MATPGKDPRGRGARLVEVAREARAAHPGDPNAVAEAVRAALGASAGPHCFAAAAPPAAGGPPASTLAPDAARRLERLVALRDAGVLTDADVEAGWVLLGERDRASGSI